MNAAFYCMSSAAYFPGAVAMINSLRLQGHQQPIHLLDLGLTPAQRELLEPHVTLTEAPPATQPWLAKTILPLARPAEVMVLIDVDMIVTRPLDELIEKAAQGSVVAFENDVDRFVAEWGEVLDLGPLRRRPYLCSGFVAIASEPGRELFGLMADRQRRVEFQRSFFAANEPGYPLLFLDQDVLNAILASESMPARDVVGLESRLMAPLPWGGPRLLDAESLRCAFDDGTEPYVVHNILPAKPWLTPMFDGLYSQLLKRCLTGPGLAIEVPPGELPLRFRSGPLAAAERRRVAASVFVRFHAGFRLARMRHRLGLAPRDPVPRP